MSVYELILKRRTIRKFLQRPISEDILRKIVNAGRLAPSAANLQPLKFIIINDINVLGKIFAALKWAGYIAPAGDPAEGQKPTAYVIVLINSEIREEKGEVDAAAAIQNMILTALEQKIGTCWIGSVNRAEVRAILNIPDQYKIDSVLALGYPAEEPVIEEAGDSIKYWKDEKGVLHVPKKSLDDLLHFNRFCNFQET